MHTTSLLHVPAKGVHSLQGWRERILAMLLGNLVPLALWIALPSIVLAMVQGMWNIALLDGAAVSILTWLWRHKSLSFSARALGFSVLLYATGASFIWVFGTYSQIYLMACVAMTAMLLGRKQAVFATAVSTLTLWGLGYGLKQDVVVPGLENQPFLAWMVIAANFALVSGIIGISIGILLRGLEHSLNDARNSELRYHTAFANSPDAMSLRRLSDGICVDVNEGFLRLHGKTRDQVVGKLFRNLNVWRDDTQRLCMEEVLLSEGEVENFEAEFVAGDGATIPGLLSAHVLMLNDEIFALSVMRDMRDRKKTEMELSNYRHRLEDLVNQRTAELEASNESLARQNEFIRLVTDSVPSLIGYWDAELRCSFANRAYQEFLGVPEGQVVGKLACDVLGEAVFQRSQTYLHAALDGSRQRFMLTARRADGNQRHLEVQYVPHHVDGKVLGVYVLADDRTDIKQAEQQLRGLNYELAVQVESAQVANRAKSDFLANMSHEIRTPMNGVLGMVDVMQRSHLTPEQRRMLDTIQKSSVSLLNILNDILDYSKIEAGKLEVEQVPTQLREVAEGAVSLIAHAAQAKNVELSVSVSPDLPLWTLSDPLRLQQVLLNLLGNAVKFTADSAHRQARVALELMPCGRSDGSAGVELRVTDSGIGMAQDMMDHLFQPFQQGEASTARRFGGTGLGLSITRQLVALMGGTIRVRSTLGEGSEFVVTLPLRPCEPGLESLSRVPLNLENRTAPPLDEAVRRRQLILLAEDNETNQDVILQQLQLLGYAAEVAPDGVVALDLWRSGRFSLLLTDCHMPRMDGYTLTGLIRAEESTQSRRLPIVAVTANAMQGEGQRCLDHGMDAYLAKPVRLDELNAVLAQWLPVSDGVVPVWNLAALVGLVGKNPAVHQRLLATFLNGAHRHVPAIVKAATAGDVITAATVAHTLKSSARSVGALALGERCQAIEIAGRAGDKGLCVELAGGIKADFARLLDAMSRQEAVPD